MNQNKRIIARLPAVGVLIAMAFAGIGEANAQSSVQGVPNAMQGFSQNRDKPIRIDSETLEMRDKKKEATFAGNVKVVQGDTTMLSDVLLVFYDNNDPANASAKAKAPATAAMPGPAGSSSIRRLEAKGHVIVTQKDQVVTGETAIYDTKTNLTTMLGNVVLTQGPNVVKGDRLIVDMTTSVSRVESDSGKVQALFQSSGKESGSILPGGSPKQTAPAKPK